METNGGILVTLDKTNAMIKARDSMDNEVDTTLLFENVETVFSGVQRRVKSVLENHFVGADVPASVAIRIQHVISENGLL